MIRKTLLLGVLVVAAVILIAPLVLSYAMGDVHQAYVQTLAQQPYLKVEQTSFSRGWFESTSSVTLAPAEDLCQDPGCPRIQVNSRIYHGPLPFGAYVQTGLSVRPVQGIAISRISLITRDSGVVFDPPLPAMIATTIIGLGGDQSVEVYWAGGATQVTAGGDSARFISKGIKGKFTHNAAGNRMTAGLQAPGLTLAASDGKGLALEDFKLGVTRRLAQPSTTTYEATLKQARFTPAGNGPPLQLDQLKLESRVEVEDGLASSEGSIGLRRLAGGNGSYGPASLDFTTSNIAYGVLERLRAQARQLSAKLPPNMLLLALLQLYQENAAALLHPGPALAVPSFKVTTPAGEISGNFHLSVPPARAGDDTSIPAVLNRLQAGFSMQLPRTLVEAAVRERLAGERARQTGEPASPVTDDDVQAVINHLIQSNLLVSRENDTQLRLALSMHDGQIYANGQKSMNLSDLLSLLRSP